jgi:hypothetical protein
MANLEGRTRVTKGTLRITGNDVNAHSTATTATVYTGRTRLKGFTAEGGGSDGTITIYDNTSATGTAILIFGVEAGTNQSLAIPDAGVLFKTGLHAVLSNVTRMTAFTTDGG